MKAAEVYTHTTKALHEVFNKLCLCVILMFCFCSAFAEVAPVYYDEITEYTDEMLDEFGIPVEEEIGTNTKQQTPVQPKPVVAKRNVAGRSVSRTVPAGKATKVASRTNISSRAVASSPRNAQQTPRSTVSRTVKTRTAATTTKKPSVVSRSRATTKISRSGTTSTKVKTQSTTLNTDTDTDTDTTSARVSATGNVISGVRDYYPSSSSTKSNILTDSGDPLYIPNSASGTAKTTRRPTVRTSGVVVKSSSLTSAEAISAADNLSAVSDLMEYCKTQYAQCMDNYCNVLDENQGKCSCSADIQSYEANEKDLTNINEEFQDAIQKIKYIGLTSAQIETLFKETEAEIALQNTSDGSDIKKSLDTIKDKILSSSFGTSATSSDLGSGVSMDSSGMLKIDVSSASLPIKTFYLDTSLTGGNTNITHPRGTELFETASERCGTAVLDACVEKGIDADIIVNSYDLAIDKDCIEYDKALKEKTTEMRNNVRNAQNILQQARLLVAQRKNAYDLRGCVEALDECMQGEYVCGEDYSLCLDPTGVYIADGALISGSKPGADTTPASSSATGLSAVWKYKGLGTNNWQLTEFIDKQLSTWKEYYKRTDTSNFYNDVASNLLTRIGAIITKTNRTTQYGMCIDVLNQCQEYTFEPKTNGKIEYKPDNDVIRQYLSLALTKIKAKQDTLLAEYAENCWTDVYTCITLNNYNESLPATNATNRTAVASCKNEIDTCMSVADASGSQDDWVANHVLSSSFTPIYVSPIDIGIIEIDPPITPIPCLYTKTAADCTDGWHASTDTCIKDGITYIRECVANVCDTSFNQTTVCGNGYIQEICKSGDNTKYKCTPIVCDVSFNQTTVCGDGYIQEICQSGDNTKYKCQYTTSAISEDSSKNACFALMDEMHLYAAAYQLNGGCYKDAEHSVSENHVLSSDKCSGMNKGTWCMVYDMDNFEDEYYGKALCSNTGGTYATVGYPNTIYTGPYCWCKIPSSSWVLASDPAINSGDRINTDWCVENCASLCIDRIWNGWRYFRPALGLDF